MSSEGWSRVAFEGPQSNIERITRNALADGLGEGVTMEIDDDLPEPAPKPEQSVDTPVVKNEEVYAGTRAARVPDPYFTLGG